MIQKPGDSRAVLLLGAVAIFAVGLTTSGYVLGDGLRRAKMAERTVTVHGVSERNVTADLATWTIGFSEEGTALAPVQQSVDRQADAARAFFQRSGFRPDEVADSDVSVSHGSATDENGKATGPEKLIVKRSIELRTSDVMKARAAFARQSELLRDGVQLSASSISYSFTRLNDLKPEMIAEADRNARKSATEFAGDSGSELGRIKSASQGYFSVGPRDGDACEDCSSTGSGSPFQKVRVVTTIDYDLS